MIASQRKAHKLIWLAMVLAIPVLLFLSLGDVNFFKSQTGRRPLNIQNGLSEVSTTNNYLSVKHSGSRLHIVVKKPIRSTSTLLYELNAKGERGMEIGQLQGVGNYAFSISPNAKGLLVVDSIKSEELFKLEF